jgi:hypothetical protein
VCCGIAFFAALVVSVFIQGERIKTQERADKVAARTEQAQDRHRRLRVDVAEAESPVHILDAARGLGMVEPGPAAAVPADPGAAAPTHAVRSTTTSSPAAPSTLPGANPGRER